MRVLFFTYDFPYPTNSGGKTRAYNLLKFAKKDAEIILFSFVRDSFDAKNTAELKKIGIEEVIVFPRKRVFSISAIPSFFSSDSFFYSLYFERKIAEQLIRIVIERKIEIVHFESFYTGFFLQKRLRELGVKQIYGTENIEHLLYEGYARYHPSLPLKLFFAQQAKKIKREEEVFYKIADCVIAVTSEERDYIAARGGERVDVIENGVDTKQFVTHRKRPSQTLLFLGNFSYFPNVDAMRWFMRDVFPFLDGVRLVVVGKRSSKISFLKHERVTTHEYVEDIRDVYSMGTIFVSPVRIGGGTNFKVLEAMASRLPVVALSDRLGSFDFIDGKELLIANDAESFVKLIKRLIESESLQQKLAKGAFEKMENEYEWTRIGQKLYNTWKSLL